MKALALILLIPGLACAGDDGLGRLFYSAEERARIDASRPSPPARAERRVRLDAILRSSDGTSTIWLNGEAKRGPQAGIAIGSDRIRIRSAGRNIEIPVGGEARLP